MKQFESCGLSLFVHVVLFFNLQDLKCSLVLTGPSVLTWLILVRLESLNQGVQFSAKKSIWLLVGC